jgi:hypothetical protein
MKRLILLFVVSLGLSTTAMADGRSNMLRSLLAVTPVSFLGPLDARWDVMFSDLPAAALAISALPADSNAIFGTPLGPLARAGLPPLTDTMDTDSLTQWPALVGFDIEQVQAILTVQAPPESVMVLRLSAGVATAVGPALLANGYARADQTYIRGQEDLSINITDRNPADPFGAGMGMASRVTVQGDLVLQSRSLPLLQDMTGQTDKLADMPEMIALLDALDAAPADLGALVRMRLLTDPLAIAAWNPLAGLTLDDMTVVTEPPKTRLPFWSIGLLADLSTPGTETAAIALVYPTRNSADTAAAVLQTAWRMQKSPATGQSFYEIVGAGVVTAVYGTGPFVTVMTVTVPTTASNGMIRNRPWSVLMQAYYQRELRLLAPMLP